MPPVLKVPGLSPRVRGNPHDRPIRMGWLRSIPARAGEPRRPYDQGCRTWVYPRACGGTIAPAPPFGSLLGLSPRVRGNRVIPPLQARECGSIPARAGEPHVIRAKVGIFRVYPRACGEPRSPDFSAMGVRVYPRACGGTPPGTARKPRREGLSPRVRGNPNFEPELLRASRSIPARAGEPSLPGFTAVFRKVYPRACGGTTADTAPSSACAGLSPRVRGNPNFEPELLRASRSIPARAGEPSLPGFTAVFRKVYPRACGGTTADTAPSSACAGLSPRVRGNLVGDLRPVHLGRSIPARAGEPSWGPSRQPLPWVYPRACGGTVLGAIAAAFAVGLSPRVRGNLVQQRSGRYGDGSIPARAGEPRPAAMTDARM